MIKGNLVFLLVSLKKESLADEHQYADAFVSPDRFRWQSQNKHRRQAGVGQLLKNHQKSGVHVHLFVRRDRKLGGGKGAPFTYYGVVAFLSWSGDAPISIEGQLINAIPTHLAGRFGVPV